MSFCSVLWRRITGKYEKLVIAPPKDFDDYIGMAGKFVSLTDTYLKRVEESEQAGDIHAVALQLPRLAMLVNVVATLRGDHQGFGDDICVGKKRNQLYGVESDLDKRFARLVTRVMPSKKETDLYEAEIKRRCYMEG